MTKYGTPIFRNEDCDCLFHYESMAKGKDTKSFSMCTNPKVGFINAKQHSMILGCPDDCEYKKEMFSKESEFVAVDNLINEFSIDNYFMISDDDVKIFIEENFEETNFEYFRFMMRYYGYRLTNDSNIPPDSILFTSNGRDD